MYIILLLALVASLACGNPTPISKSFLANFDDKEGSGVAPELFPVPTPYDGLAYSGFNLYNTTEAITLLKAQSLPNVAASITVLQMAQGKSAMITTAGTTTKSFGLTNLFNGCVVASQTGLVAESCTIQYNGVKADKYGTKVSAQCIFTVTDILKPVLAKCTFPSAFASGLKSVSVVPVQATALPESTVVFIDTVSGSIVA